VRKTDDTDEARELLVELRDALQEHIRRLRKMAADKLGSGVNGNTENRRPER
jgi:hypothetical protein